MKKLALAAIALSIGFASYAQKDEVKAAEKALKKGDLDAAKSAIEQAEGKLEDKYKAKFYFTKAKTYYELAKKSSDGAAYETAAKSFNNLLSFEKESGKAKYTKEAQPILNALISEVSQKGIKEYQEKDYKNAKSTLYQTYTLTPKDTVFLEYAAMAAYNDKDFDSSLKHFNSLKDLGYTGIATTYTATNVETGEAQSFPSKDQMDLMVKSKQYKDPKTETSESKRGGIIKNIAFILIEKGEKENALTAIREARGVDPKDIGLIISEANILLKLGDKDGFAGLMKEAIEQDPNNASLHFNIGVINQEQGKIEEAKVNYNKAIEIDPNYADAYINLGSALLEKDKALVEEMNKNLNNFKKYDAVKAKQSELYKEVVPLYEKAYELKTKESGKPDVDLARTLMGLYENLEMDAKYKEMKAIYDSSKG